MSVPSSITDLIQTAGSNSPAGGDSVFPNLDNYIRAIESFIAVLRDGKGLSAELDVASSGTCDIGASNSPFARITGTTTITSFGTNYNGPRYLRFAEALILTHSSTLVLPGAANITTVAGDTCVVIPGATSGTADKWVVVAYQRASGEFLTAVTRAQLQAQTYTAFTTGGTSSAFTLTPAPAITAYAENQTFDVEFNAASTGTPTLNISAVGAKSLKYRDALGALVTCGTLIPSGWRSKVTYDGTDMIVREMPTAVITVGQGRMTKVGSDLVFARYQGRFLTANGVVYEIPSGGVTIAPTSNTANTTYYQYAVISAGAISSTGEYSATGYTVGSDGVAYKTGDTSRVMVGMARSGTSGGTWSSIATEVRSWFNRGTLTADTEITTTLTVTAAASSTEFANGGTPVRGGLVCFADDMVRAEAKLVVGHSSTSVYTNVSIGVDGGSALVGTMDPQNDYDTTNNNYPRYVYGQANLSEGWHDVRIYGYQTSGTFTIAPGSGTAGERPRITVTVSGG